MKKAFYLFISVLLVLFSTNKVNDSRTIKRVNEQSNKQEIILIYSSNDTTSDIYNYEMTQDNETARAKVSSTFKISTNRRYILAMRTNKPNLPMHNVMAVLMGWSGLSTPMSGEQIYNYLKNNDPQYQYVLNYHFNKSSQEGGYFTYYLNLSSFGTNNNIQEMYMSLMQQGNPNIEFNDFIQDIFVYDITYITTQGETWYNYQDGGTCDPAEIQASYDKGYSDAVKSGTGLNWLQSAFNMITNILNIEILPNIKIAYLVAIPLLIELVLFVLRFIK